MRLPRVIELSRKSSLKLLFDRIGPKLFSRTNHPCFITSRNTPVDKPKPLSLMLLRIPGTHYLIPHLHNKQISGFGINPCLKEQGGNLPTMMRLVIKQMLQQRAQRLFVLFPGHIPVTNG